jgi:hypothetical protein
MTIGQSLRSVFSSLMRYLVVFLPLTTVLFLPIYYLGDLLGATLIQVFGEVFGLFLRPLVISMFYIFVFFAMLSSRLEKFNQYLWFSRFSTQEIKRIYKTYIYGITSIFGITLIVVCFTLSFGANFWINWFDSRNYLSLYFLVVLVFAPLIATIPRRAI